MNALLWVLIPVLIMFSGCSDTTETTDVPYKTDMFHATQIPPQHSAELIAPEHLFFISIDTLRPDFLGCYGNPNVHTPNIDRLARVGQQFRQCVVPLGRTNPSVASMMTSLYPHEHTVRALWDKLPQEFETLAERMKGAGFITTFVNGNSLLNPQSGITQGFDTYQGPRSGIVSFFKPDSTPVKRDRQPREGWKAKRITRTAIEELNQMEAGAQIFLWTHFMDPHWSYSPPQPFSEFYTEALDYAKLNRAMAIPAGDLRYKNNLPDDIRKHLRNLYAGEVAYTDHEVGKLLRHLDETGLRKDAVVALTSDHGEAMGEKGFYYCHGDEVYRESINVPLMIWNPNIVRGEVRQEAVSSLVITGEILSLFQQKPLVDTRVESIIFAETDAWSMRQNTRKYFDGIKGKWRMALDDTHKLVWIPHPDGAITELYNVVNDPAERQNLVKTQPDKTQQLNSRLMEWIDEDAMSELETGKPTPKSSDLQEKLRNLGYIQ